MTTKEANEIMWQDKEESTRRALALIGNIPALYSHAKENMRVHGNGFIQIDIAPHLRLHIWEEAIPCQATNTPIHDHRFGFESLILTGTLVNVSYEAIPESRGEHVSYGRLHRLYNPVVRNGEDTVLVPAEDEEVWMLRQTVDYHPAGSEYSFEAFDFHETRYQGLTATLLRKIIEYPRHVPRVACLSHLKPDNDFDRYKADRDLMWAIVNEVSLEVRRLYRDGG